MANLLIIFNHTKNEAKALNSRSNGMLGFHKETKSFSCDASDMDCMGVKNIPPIFDVMIEKNGHKKTFILKHTNRDEEMEIRFWEYRATDGCGISFTIFND